MTAAERLRAKLTEAADALGVSGVEVQLERPRNPEHGDWATNLAMTLAGRLRKPPRTIAEELVSRLDLTGAGVRTAEVAGPGFINFRLSGAAVEALLERILTEDEGFGRIAAAVPRRVMVEFVSANPTGPLHVAHGRGAALGDAIATLLEWTGDRPHREFYVNDAGVQIDRLAESVDARWRQERGEDAAIPEGGYHGEYVREIARSAREELGERLDAAGDAERVGLLREWAVDRLRAGQVEDLVAFGVVFDEWYPESRVYAEGRIRETLAELAERGLTYESEGALWLRTTAFGDDKDRVMVKQDGTYTYFLPDLAYHREKARRGFDHAVNVWGADHHGYIGRMKAGLEALGHPGFLDVEIVQMVRILRGGKEAKLSKRAGDFVTLRELFEETGPDVARYFFLMRRCDSQMLFDLDLALDRSDKNPIYKVQYAHARMMSIFRKAGVSAGQGAGGEPPLDRLETDTERDLIKQLARFPEIVQRAASDRAPHVVCDYLEETAGTANSWYHAGNPSRSPELAVLVDDPELREARLALARGVRIVLRNGLRILGISAPDRMEREERE
ncbi:MAG TPA: arginine--tRNA ligase [Longimicrobiales bacterium]|nr:arginine--tRNA ligase [Longimicrobiales bacterium]